MRLFIVIFSSVYFLINLYLGKRLLRLLHFVWPRFPGLIFVILYAALAASFILARLDIPPFWKNLANQVGSIWLGFFVYLLLFFILSDVIILVGRLAGQVTPDNQLAVKKLAGLGVIILTLITVSYGMYQGKQIETVTYEVSLDRPLKQELTVVLIADIHLGDTDSESRLGDIVERINQAEPDLVVIAGDIFSDDYASLKDPKKVEETLRSIKTRYGVYASLGNHDGGPTFPDMLALLGRSYITLLLDESVKVAGQLEIMGRLDASPIGGYGYMHRVPYESMEKTIKSELPLIVIEHNPIHLDEYNKRVDLILSGHTHKGQIFPGSLFTRAIYQVDYGHYEGNQEQPQMVVTSGVSTWGLPLRIGSQNEIVIIKLK